MFVGHRREDGGIQELRTHLENVARKAKHFASPFNAGEHAFRTGLLHDIGKYAFDVQKRMKDPEHTPKCNHTSAGAQIAARQYRDAIAAFAIAGHHGGLQDRGDLRTGKLSYHPMDFSAYKKEISLQTENVLPQWPKTNDEQSFYTRMLFSCLVDADYLDTEAFMQPETIQRGMFAELGELLDKVENYIKPWFPPQTQLNRIRCKVLEECKEASTGSKGLFSLTVPTGGGKTVSSLRFALQHAVRHGLERVIYVVPYMSIIEQTAQVFSMILGEENVLEHHSGAVIDEMNAEDIQDVSAQKKQFATENWDAPIVITTAVQFFESIYHNKASRMRKLHNIANSVIIFDEAQMMPLSYLRPCVFAISELVKHYGASAVLCTATQPALAPLFDEYYPDGQIREITTEPERLHSLCKRVQFLEPETVDMEQLAISLQREHQALCIVNTRATAKNLLAMTGEANCFHLSTLMTPRHRRNVLTKIRQLLKSGLRCIVISTSLIEAGVDIDFPVVYRELTGLDSILQSAGRCNREGKRPVSDSQIHLFSLNGVGQHYEQQKRISGFRYAIENGIPIDSSLAIQRYSAFTIFQQGEGIDKKQILEQCRRFNYETVANEFKLIDEDTENICIPNEDNSYMIEALRHDSYSRNTLRHLQQDMVSIYHHEAEKMIKAGRVQKTNSGLMILVDSTGYDPVCGLDLQTESGKVLFM